MSRTLLPPTLKTVSLPTWSAAGKTLRRSTKDEKSCRLARLYQCAKADRLSGYWSANRFRRLRLMMCMIAVEPLHAIVGGETKKARNSGSGAAGLRAEAGASCPCSASPGRDAPAPFYFAASKAAWAAASRATGTRGPEQDT